MRRDRRWSNGPGTVAGFLWARRVLPDGEVTAVVSDGETTLQMRVGLLAEPPTFALFGVATYRPGGRHRRRVPVHRRLRRVVG